MILPALLLSAAVDLTKPLDCGAAFATRNALAREEAGILGTETGRRLTKAERERLAAIRKRRGQLLVCA